MQEQEVTVRPRTEVRFNQSGRGAGGQQAPKLPKYPNREKDQARLRSAASFPFETSSSVERARTVSSLEAVGKGRG